MVRRLLLSALAAAFAGSPVFAQDAPTTKWYASVDVGSAKNGLSEYAYGRQVAPRDDSSAAFRLRAGYQFIRYFALEAALADLGSFSNGVDMSCSGAPQDVCVPDFRSDIDVRTFGLFAVGMLPIGERFTIRATIGLPLREKTTRKVYVDGTVADHTGHMVMGSFGFGAGFKVTKRLEIYAEWNRYDGESGHPFPGTLYAPGQVVEEGRIEIASLGARWRF